MKATKINKKKQDEIYLATLHLLRMRKTSLASMREKKNCGFPKMKGNLSMP